jgi:acyl-CoA synthetase (AMP-forming)/AMP-acid ligase II
VTADELLEFCRSRIAHYKSPRSIEFLESLPKTATGKVLKRNLRKRYWSEHQGSQLGASKSAFDE